MKKNSVNLNSPKKTSINIQNSLNFSSKNPFELENFHNIYLKIVYESGYDINLTQ